jgi:hypothetical protein
MSRKLLKIVDGPDKPALQWALAYPDREQVHFVLAGDATDAAIVRIEEIAEGFTFEINGRLTTGTYKGQPFQGIYSVETRSGSIALGIGA